MYSEKKGENQGKMRLAQAGTLDRHPGVVGFQDLKMT